MADPKQHPGITVNRITNPICCLTNHRPLQKVNPVASGREVKSSRATAPPIGARGKSHFRGFQLRSIFAFLRENSGAAAAEYAFILAIVGSAIATAALTLSNDIDNALTGLGSVLTSVVFTTS